MPNWLQVLDEIERTQMRLHHESETAIDKVRRKYLRKLHQYTGRPIIAYYSGWLTNPGLPGADVNDEDKTAFMMAVHRVGKDKGLDLILHTPGGGVAAAESLVDYLRSIFGKDIRAIVPHMAMSAGTMIACACRAIVMGKHSNLGPIDPQIDGIPAAAVSLEIERALEETAREPHRMNFWRFVLGKYEPTFVDTCENAVEWAKEFVTQRLIENMFAHEPDPARAAHLAVAALTDFKGNRSHARHIHIDRCKEIGLRIETLEDDQHLQDAVLTVHHCFMHTIAVGRISKIIENHQGALFIRAA